MAADATGGTNPEETDSVTLRTFNSRDAAELAAAKLDANGIPCRIDSDDCAGMYPNLALARGVRLIVSAADAAAAAELLDDRSTVPDEVAEKSPMPVETQEGNSSGLLWIGIFIGLVLGIVLTMLFMGRVRPGNQIFYSRTPDGAVYESWVYRNGHLFELAKDRNQDGKWDEWVYYDHGKMASVRLDNNFDGRADEWWTYSNGIAVKMEKDADFNGIVDEIGTYKNGIGDTFEIKPNGSRFATQRWSFTNGVPVEIWRDGDSNGVFHEIVKYDSFFNATNRQFGDFRLLWN